MSDGITYVDTSHDPIIHEGEDAATVIVMNAGPSTVELRAWREVSAEKEPEVKVHLWPGNTKSVSGHLIRAHTITEGPFLSSHYYPGPFAAIGWRVVR